MIRARDLALKHLMKLKQPNGIWQSTFDFSAFLSAAYIIMLRTTGLIEWSESFKVEARLVRHMINQVNPDGGFYKYPGSPSSRTVTRLAFLALRMVLGEAQPGHRPQAWFQANRTMGKDLESKVCEALNRVQRLLRTKKMKTSFTFECDHLIPERILCAYSDTNRIIIHPPFLEPEILARAYSSPRLCAVLSQFNTFTRKTFPAISILARRSLERNRFSKSFLRILKLSKVFCRTQERSLRELRDLILREQNTNGGWFYSPLYTVLNLMALLETGITRDDIAIVRAHNYLRDSMFVTEEGGIAINNMNNDIWDTCLAVNSYLLIPGHTCIDKEIRPSVEFLLKWQNDDGSFGWASASRNDPDHDSTAFALLTLAVASRSDDGLFTQRVNYALKKGLAYLLPRQDTRGGFSAWQATFVRSRRGPINPIAQYIFDLPTADVTARVLATLCLVGLTERDAAVRKCLSFIIKTQCKNGSWWCRWWAGYLGGTSFVLGALSQMGLRCRPNPYDHDHLMGCAHDAMMKGIDFLLQHQNADGGWGETVRSDYDMAHAGVGESTPLHTASVLYALVACGYPLDSAEIRQGYEYLLRTVTPDGRWKDEQVNFTVFVRATYYQYPFMNYILPLNALTKYLKSCGESLQS